jgi:hypothetical protein
MVSSRWSLSLDLLSGKALVWFATWGRDAELTRDAHRYFYDRYSRLSDYHRRHGHTRKALRFEAKAEQHRVDGDGPPYAAAMAMPRPRRFTRTRAVATAAWQGPDDAA